MSLSRSCKFRYNVIVRTQSGHKENINLEYQGINLQATQFSKSSKFHLMFCGRGGSPFDFSTNPYNISNSE